MDTEPLAHGRRAAERRGRQPVMAWTRRAFPSLEPEPQRRDAEERKESDDIRHCGHEHARRDRRVSAEAMEHEWHQNAAERPGHEIADHGKADHQAKIGHLEPRRRRDAGDDGESQTIDQGDEHFAQDDASDVGVRQFVPRERTHHHRHGLRRGVAALARHDRRQHGQRYHFLQLTLEQAENRRGQESSRKISQQPVEAPARDEQRGIRQFLLAAHPAEGPNVLLGLLLDHVDDVVESDDTNEPVLRVDDGGRDEVVVFEQARHVSLVVGNADRVHLLVNQLCYRHRTFGAQQPVERDRTLQPARRTHYVDLPEAIGQIGRLAQMVDRAPDGPYWRNGYELGLHAPTGGVFRVEQAARERDALKRRELLQNLGLLVLRQVRQDGHRIVGFELAHAFGHRLGRQLFENLFADGVVDLGQRRKIEVVAHQLDQLGTQLRLERLDQIADVSLVQIADEFAQRRGILRRDRLRNALDKVGAHRSFLIAQRDRGRSHFLFLEHLRPAAINGTNALGFYARYPKLAIANELDTSTDVSSSRALRAAAGAIAAGVERLSCHSPGRDLQRFAAGPSL